MNTNETEISAAEPTGPPKLSFGQRLRAALGTLDEGNCITLRTKEDRQTITNAVLAVKKKTGFKLTTEMLQRRDDEGKMIIRIKRLDEGVA